MSSEKSGWSVEQVTALLEKVPLFQGLPRSDLERIAGLVRGRSIKAGEFLFREGDKGDRFYIVFAGAMEILKERPRGDHERLAVMRSGGAFGEMSLLTDSPRSASVRAAEDSQLLVVSREQFDELLGGESLAVRLMKGLARALRALDVRFAAKDAGASGGDALREFSRLVQHGLLPRNVPQVDGYEIAAAAVTPESASGRTLWDAIALDGGVLFAVYHVKGSGLPPANLLAVARALLREIVRTERALPRIATRLNAALTENLFEGLDEYIEVTLCHAAAGGVSYSIAGEQPALVVRAGGDVEMLTSQGPPLGILPQFDYEVGSLELGGGDIVLLLTELDGGVVRGAGELVRGRSSESAARLALDLQTALSKIQETDGEDVALTVIKRK